MMNRERKLHQTSVVVVDFPLRIRVKRFIQILNSGFRDTMVPPETANNSRMAKARHVRHFGPTVDVISLS